MIEISLNKITKSYGFKNILENLSFEVKEGEIIAIIGENGCGKTTLLNIISGKEYQDSGTVSIRKGSSIGYLKQIPEERDNTTVEEYLYESVEEILKLEKTLRNLENRMANLSGKELNEVLNKYGNLQEKYISLGGYEVNTKINKIISGFKIEHLLNHMYNTLSGGEKRIVNLASIMIKEPNILLLDEPTNHLDMDTLEWFEDYLKKYKGTILLVSHDRYFLDKVATKTILIEAKKPYIFHGNYSYFLEENKNRIEREFKDYKDQQKLIIALKKKIKQLEEFGKLAYPGGDPFFRRAEHIKKRLEKLEKLEKPVEKKELPINFSIEYRSGKDVLVMRKENINIGGNILISNINCNISYKDRVCILGPNGCGKSTFLKHILNNKTDNTKIGSNIKIGYIPQEIDFNENITVLDYASRYYHVEEHYLRSALSKFYFYGENVFKKISTLSGGEKVRLKLFELMHTNCNFLILDEPTNHIDINTREMLEDALNKFEGTILFVSHDRYFINCLANKIFYINNKQLKEYIGNYDDIKNNYDIMI